MKAIILATFISLSASAGNLVEFHIAKGTGNGAWNTEATTVLVMVGDTLRIYNDDTINHQLHTNGSPCPHGSVIKPGKSADCMIASPYSFAANGALYDHAVGDSARFYLLATPSVE